MRNRSLVASGVVAVVIASAAVLFAAQVTSPPAAGAATHVMFQPADIKWGPAPSLPAGAQLAVLDGDPSKDGPFSIRAKFPDGYMVPPHWHPTDENVVVLEGVISLGMGEKADPAAALAFPVGSFAKLPAKKPHFAMAKGETIIQIYGQGPFVLNYVNPSDDPLKKKD